MNEIRPVQLAHDKQLWNIADNQAEVEDEEDAPAPKATKAKADKAKKPAAKAEAAPADDGMCTTVVPTHKLMT